METRLKKVQEGEYDGILLAAAGLKRLGLEKEISTFFRLHNPSIIAKLRESFPDLDENPDPKELFGHLLAWIESEVQSIDMCRARSLL